MQSTGFPTSYAEFRYLITQRCGTALTRAYCVDRITSLRNQTLPHTRKFIELYGSDHCQQIIAWYEQAFREATE